VADLTFIGAGGAITSFPSTSLDAFGRLRIGEPYTAFEAQFEYDLQPLIWQSVTAGGGSVTHLPNESSVSMALGIANGDSVIRQTKKYFRYQPGKSQLVTMTALFGPEKTNVVSRVGYFDANNGVFFYRDALGAAVGLRTSVTGAPITTLVRQVDWNLDTLDGTGPSGKTLDLDQTQIVWIDFQWLGVGRVRYGYNIDGNLIYCHEINNSNVQQTVYMTTGNLPLRYEIVNVGVAPSASEMKQICSTVISEGGFTPYGVVRSADVGSTARAASAGTPLPLLSIRLKASYPRATIVPLRFSALPVGNDDFRVRLMLNAALTGPAWNPVSATAATEFDIAATAIAGGNALWTFYTNEATSNDFSELSSLDLVADVAGVSDILTVEVTPIANANVLGALNYRELF
jgi:hypothetical protein